MPNFEVFDKRAVPLVKRPQATIQSKGTISMNLSAFHALGEPEAVELLYDRRERIVGIRPVSPEVAHAYPVRNQGGGKSYLVSGNAFVKYYDIPCEKPIRYDLEIRDGIAMIDLKKEGQVVISNRNRAKLAREAAEADRDNRRSPF